MIIEPAPGLKVELGPPILDTGGPGRPRVPEVQSVVCVTLHGGIFVPNGEHQLVDQGILQETDLHGLSLVAGGTTLSGADQILFGSDPAKRSQINRHRLERAQGKLGLMTLGGLVATGFDDHLLEIVKPIDPAPRLSPPSLLEVIEAAADDLDSDGTSIVLGFKGRQNTHKRRKRAFRQLEVPNIEAAITVTKLASLLPPPNEVPMSRLI